MEFSIPRDGYTNGGNLIGNTVGRSGQTYQGWLTCWISSTNTIQLSYKSSLVDQIFVPGGGVWQDVGVSTEIHTRSGVYLKTLAQYEHISHFPILFKGPQQNVTEMVEIDFLLLCMKRGARRQTYRRPSEAVDFSFPRGRTSGMRDEITNRQLLEDMLDGDLSFVEVQSKRRSSGRFAARARVVWDQRRFVGKVAGLFVSS